MLASSPDELFGPIEQLINALERGSDDARIGIAADRAGERDPG